MPHHLHPERGVTLNDAEQLNRDRLRSALRRLNLGEQSEKTRACFKSFQDIASSPSHRHTQLCMLSLQLMMKVLLLGEFL